MERISNVTTLSANLPLALSGEDWAARAPRAHLTFGLSGEGWAARKPRAQKPNRVTPNPAAPHRPICFTEAMTIPPSEPPALQENLGKGPTPWTTHFPAPNLPRPLLFQEGVSIIQVHKKRKR